MNNTILEISDAIKELYPNCSFSIVNNDYNTIIWSENNNLPIPTLDQINTKLNELKLLEPLKRLREERNKKLDETDKYLTTDFVYPSGVTKQNWLDYRQALRDLPSNSQPEIDENGNLKNVEWPVSPTT